VRGPPGTVPWAPVLGRCRRGVRRRRPPRREWRDGSQCEDPGTFRRRRSAIFSTGRHGFADGREAIRAGRNAMTRKRAMSPPPAGAPARGRSGSPRQRRASPGGSADLRHLSRGHCSVGALATRRVPRSRTSTGASASARATSSAGPGGGPFTERAPLGRPGRPRRAPRRLRAVRPRSGAAVLRRPGPGDSGVACPHLDALVANSAGGHLVLALL